MYAFHWTSHDSLNSSNVCWILLLLSPSEIADNAEEGMEGDGKMGCGAIAVSRSQRNPEARLFMSSDPHLLNDPSWRNSSATDAAVNSTIANSTHKTSWFSTLPEIGRPNVPTDATTARKPAS